MPIYIPSKRLIPGEVKPWYSVDEAGIRKPAIDDYTKLLLHCNGIDGSQDFPDSSFINPKTITAQGDAQVDTAQKKFGTGSALFDGTGDYLSVPDSADWYMASGNFTFDFWMRFNSSVAACTFIRQETDATHLFSLWYYPTDNTMRFYNYNGGGVNNMIVAWTWNPSADTWYHVALVRKGTAGEADWLCFVDGSGLSINWSEYPTHDMHDWSGVLKIGNNLDGWLDELRVSKGIARWTSNFTPPTHEYGS